MKIIFLFIALLGAGSARSFQATPALQPLQKAVAGRYTVKLIDAGAGTYGYEIYTNNKLFIRQTTIPGVPGNKGFQQKADAQKVAGLVVSKLSHGIMPPTIEKKEMDKLHIQY